MDARRIRAALLAAVLWALLGASYRTPNFIIQTADPRLAEAFGNSAEQLRHDLAISWTGEAMRNWSQPCPITVQVAPHLAAGGATTFMFQNGDVYGWRMTIQGTTERVLDSVLPHEITHMILASHFRSPVPRWADEGAASTVEHSSERAKHSQALMQFLQTHRGIAFNRMFAMTEYPQDILPLYAQGYSLAEFLIEQGGRQQFVAFLGEGMRDNQWGAATLRHYGVPDLGTLQTQWLAWVAKGSPPLRPREERPGSIGQGTLLASNTPLPRPEPNLIYRTATVPSPQPSPTGRGDLSRPSPGGRGDATEPSTRGIGDSRLAARRLVPVNWDDGNPGRSEPPLRSQVSRPQPVEQLEGGGYSAAGSGFGGRLIR